MLKPNPSKPKVGANALRSLLVAERKRGRNERERRLFVGTRRMSDRRKKT